MWTCHVLSYFWVFNFACMQEEGRWNKYCEIWARKTRDKRSEWLKYRQIKGVPCMKNNLSEIIVKRKHENNMKDEYRSNVLSWREFKAGGWKTHNSYSPVFFISFPPPPPLFFIYFRKFHFLPFFCLVQFIVPIILIFPILPKTQKFSRRHIGHEHVS